MAIITAKNTGLQFNSPGDKQVIQRVSANGLTTVKNIVIPVKSDPTIITTPGLNYPPQALYSSTAVLPMARPGYLQYVEELSYGVLPGGKRRIITRITDSAVFGVANPTHHYSKTEPWNCDGTRMIVEGRLLDGNTYKIISKVNGFGVNHQWSRTDNDKIFGTNSQVFRSIKPSTNVATNIKDFKPLGWTRLVLGENEGKVSDDDRYVVLTGTKNSVLTVAVLDIQTATILYEAATASLIPAGNALDAAQISPSGNYIFIKSADANGNSTYRILNKNLTFLRDLPTGSHGDVGIDIAGNEVLASLLGTKYSNIVTGTTQSLTATSVLKANSISGSGHMSCCNRDRDGYAYASFKTTLATNDGRGEIVSFKLDNSGLCERWCYVRGLFGAYQQEVKGAPNMQGNKVCFSCQWVGQTEINSYVVQIV